MDFKKLEHNDIVLYKQRDKTKIGLGRVVNVELEVELNQVQVHTTPDRKVSLSRYLEVLNNLEDDNQLSVLLNNLSRRYEQPRKDSTKPSEILKSRSSSFIDSTMEGLVLKKSNVEEESVMLDPEAVNHGNDESIGPVNEVIKKDSSKDEEGIFPYIKMGSKVSSRERKKSNKIFYIVQSFETYKYIIQYQRMFKHYKILAHPKWVNIKNNYCRVLKNQIMFELAMKTFDIKKLYETNKNLQNVMINNLIRIYKKEKQIIMTSIFLNFLKSLDVRIVLQNNALVTNDDMNEMLSRVERKKSTSQVSVEKLNYSHSLDNGNVMANNSFRDSMISSVGEEEVNHVIKENKGKGTNHCGNEEESDEESDAELKENESGDDDVNTSKRDDLKKKNRRKRKLVAGENVQYEFKGKLLANFKTPEGILYREYVKKLYRNKNSMLAYFSIVPFIFWINNSYYFSSLNIEISIFEIFEIIKKLDSSQKLYLSLIFPKEKEEKREEEIKQKGVLTEEEEMREEKEKEIESEQMIHTEKDEEPIPKKTEVKKKEIERRTSGRLKELYSLENKKELNNFVHKRISKSRGRGGGIKRKHKIDITSDSRKNVSGRKRMKKIEVDKDERRKKQEEINEDQAETEKLKIEMNIEESEEADVSNENGEGLEEINKEKFDTEENKAKIKNEVEENKKNIKNEVEDPNEIIKEEVHNKENCINEEQLNSTKENMDKSVESINESTEFEKMKKIQMLYKYCKKDINILLYVYTIHIYLNKLCKHVIVKVLNSKNKNRKKQMFEDTDFLLAPLLGYCYANNYTLTLKRLRKKVSGTNTADGKGNQIVSNDSNSMLIAERLKNQIMNTTNLSSSVIVRGGRRSKVSMRRRSKGKEGKGERKRNKRRTSIGRTRRRSSSQNNGREPTRRNSSSRSRQQQVTNKTNRKIINLYLWGIFNWNYRKTLRISFNSISNKKISYFDIYNFYFYNYEIITDLASIDKDLNVLMEIYTEIKNMLFQNTELYEDLFFIKTPGNVKSKNLNTPEEITNFWMKTLHKLSTIKNGFYDYFDI